MSTFSSWSASGPDEAEDLFGAHPDEPPWEHLHRSGLELWSRQNRRLTPVFVFDQFEDVLTLGQKTQVTAARGASRRIGNGAMLELPAFTVGILAGHGAYTIYLSGEPLMGRDT